MFGLSAYAEFVSRSLDQVEALTGIGSEHLRKSWADSAAVEDPAQWKESVQIGMSSTIDLTRDVVLSMSKHQIEMLGLVHDQAEELQKFMAAHLTRQLAHLEAVRPASVFEEKTVPAARRRAA